MKYLKRIYSSSLSCVPLMGGIVTIRNIEKYKYYQSMDTRDLQKE